MPASPTRVVTGLLVRGERILVVATRYPGRPEPLWNLPGGRARPREFLGEALVREFDEETGVAAGIESLCYIAESFDPVRAVHVMSTTFAVSVAGEPHRTNDPAIVDLAWLTPAELSTRIAVAVVREPLLAYLAGDARRYFTYADAGISIAFASEP